MNHFLSAPKQIDDLRGGAIADAQPDEFCRLPEDNASPVKIAVLRYNSETMLRRPLRDGAVIGSK